MQKEVIRFAEMFSGPGGMSKGAALAAQELGCEISHAWAIDYDPPTCLTYSHNIFGSTIGEMDDRMHCWDVSEHADDIASLPEVDVFAFGFPCFSGDTMVLTRNGYVEIQGINIGDEVLTHKGRWRRVVRTMSRKEAPLFCVRGHGIHGVKVTNEHPMYVRKKGSEVAEWVEVKDLQRGDLSCHVLPPEEDVNTWSKEKWRLVGRYLADGWCLPRRDRKHGGRVVMCCATNESEDLKSIIEDAGYHGTRVNEKSIVKFHICSNELYESLKAFGRFAHGKTLPLFALTLNKDLSHALLEGYESGDGHECVKMNLMHLRTVSKALALSMTLLVHKVHGNLASMREIKCNPTTVIEGRVVNQRTAYTVVYYRNGNLHPRVDGQYAWKYIKHVDPIGLHDVYNLEVEDDNSYMADGMLAHNCNSYSLIGKQEGLDNTKFGTLYTCAQGYLKSRWPKAFVAENVSGLSSANQGKAFAQILHDLEYPDGETDDPARHYVLTVHLYDASDYKVPQERERYLITGLRADLGLKFKPPAPMPGKVTSQMALEIPPIPIGAPNHELTNQSETVTQRLIHIPEGENAWSDAIPKHLRLAESCTQLSQTYKRLHSQKPSYTITGSGGGGSHVYHYSEPRALTNRERARLQSFPDDFVFVGKKEQVRKQVGMAVPCLLAKALFMVLIPLLQGEDHGDTIHPNRDVKRLQKIRHHVEIVNFVVKEPKVSKKLGSKVDAISLDQKHA